MLEKITYTVELFQAAAEYKNLQVSCPEDVPGDLVREMFADVMHSHEEIHAMYFNNNLQLRYTERISTGGLNSCIMNFDKILTTMAIQRVPRVILIHNHPSGNPKFSQADHRLYERANKICKEASFEVLDFMMVDPDYTVRSIRNH